MVIRELESVVEHLDIRNMTVNLISAGVIAQVVDVRGQHQRWKQPADQRARAGR